MKTPRPTDVLPKTPKVSPRWYETHPKPNSGGAQKARGTERVISVKSISPVKNKSY